MFVFAFVGAASPGPVNIIATSSSVNFGLRRTLGHVIGASVSYAFIVLTAGLGLSTSMKSYPQLADYMSYIGAALLLYMSYKIATSRSAAKVKGVAKAPSFLQGALVQMLNPKAWLVAISGVSLFVTPYAEPMLYLLMFVLVSLGVCFLGIMTWALLGQLISSYLSKERNIVLFNRAMAVLLSMSVVLLFV